jgi:hypothetical protein
VAVTIGSLTPGATYTIRYDGVAFTTATADGAGRIAFTHPAPTAGTHVYTLS